MLKRHFSYKVWLTFFLVVLLFSCRKEQASVSILHEMVAERFFNEHRTNSTEEKQLVDYLSRLNEKKGFINKTVERIGFPHWDKLVKYSFLSNSSGNVASLSTGGSSKQDSATNYIIPFVRDTQNHVNAVMFIQTDKGDTSISYLCDWQYSKFRTPAQISQAEDVAIFFMLFDRQVNGHKKFDVLDSALFRKDNKKAFSVSIKNTDSSNTIGFSMYSCTIITVFTNTCLWVGHCNGYQGSCDWCTRCFKTDDITLCDWVQSVNPPPGFVGRGGSVSDVGGGGSGGNDGAAPPSNDDGLRPGWRWAGKNFIPPVFDPNNPWDDIDNYYEFPEIPIIENGISISDNVGPLNNPKKIGSYDRENRKDMLHGTSGDLSILGRYRVWDYTSDLVLFTTMRTLFFATTLPPGSRQYIFGLLPLNAISYTDAVINFPQLDWSLSQVGREMVNRFESRVGGEFENPKLNEKVFESHKFKNFLKDYGLALSKKLRAVGGKIDLVDNFDIEGIRPKFNTPYDKFHGLMILINDTETGEILGDNFTIDAQGNWSIDLSITITDHFGIDDDDVITYKGENPGFPAWWILQHRRDYVPFKTVIKIKKHIWGNMYKE